MKAQDLDGTHLGYEVRVKAKNVQAQGTLLKVEHGADIIHDAPLGASEFNYPPALGRQWVALELAGGTLRVEPTADVEVRVS